MKYIIVGTDYLTKRAEKKEVKEKNEHKVVDFLRENIFYKFSFPRELVTDQGTQFTLNMIKDIMKQHHIKHRASIS